MSHGGIPHPWCEYHLGGKGTAAHCPQQCPSDSCGVRAAKGVKGSKDVTGEGAVCRDHVYRFRRG